MSGQFGDDDEQFRPPVYDEDRGSNDNNNNNTNNTFEEDELLQPVILIMEGRFVHPESANSKPLYELSQDVDRLSRSYSTHTLERLEHGVATTAQNVPRITRRRRRVYNLKHVSPALSPSYPFQAEALSKQSIGHLGLCRPSPHIPYLQGEGSSRVVMLKERAESSAGLPKGYNAFQPAEIEVGQVFAFQQKKQKQRNSISNGQGHGHGHGHGSHGSSRHYEWTNTEGERLAMEDDADGQHKLVVTREVTRQTMDALVACWCLRMWRHNSEIEPKLEGWEKITEKMRDVRQKLAMAPNPSVF